MTISTILCYRLDKQSVCNSCSIGDCLASKICSLALLKMALYTHYNMYVDSIDNTIYLSDTFINMRRTSSHFMTRFIYVMVSLCMSC